MATAQNIYRATKTIRTTMKTYEQLINEASLMVDIDDIPISKAAQTLAKKAKKLIDGGMDPSEAVSKVIETRARPAKIGPAVRRALVKYHGFSKKEVGLTH